MTTEQSAAITAHLAELLRAKAFRQRVSQGALAEAAGIHRATVSEYLNGHKTIPMNVYLDICAALGVSPGELLADAQRDAT